MSDEPFPALCDDPEVLKDLQYACDLMAEIEVMIPEEDLEETTVTVNAAKLYDMLDTLLTYAGCYESDAVDVDEMLTFAGITLSTQTARSDGKFH